MTSQQRPLGTPGQDEYRILRDQDLRDYLAALPAVVAQLGGAPAAWSVSEVGDGNLNLVFIVRGRAAGSPSSRRCPMCVWSRKLAAAVVALAL